MRVGLACPYPWDVPGGVLSHVRDLAEALLLLGHDVSVMAPVNDDDAPLPPYVVPAGRAVPVPFNGSVARVAFGPVSAARVRRWLRDGRFDVLHLHSPETPSVSLLACVYARGPIVATFHQANARSRMLAALQPALQPQLEKIQGRIAVSAAARTTIVEHLGGDAVVIPNGVWVDAYAAAEPLPGWPGAGGAIGFLGRVDESRKGLAVLLAAFATLAPHRPGLRLLVAGPGDAAEVRRDAPAEVRDRVVVLGQLSEADKVRFFHSVDVYVAPNTGGESFGIILLEAMAAGGPIVASDLAAFRRVLDDGRAGRLFPAGDAAGLAGALAGALDDPAGRGRLVERGRELVRRYDWPRVAGSVVEVYETVLAAAVPGPVAEDESAGPVADGMLTGRPATGVGRRTRLGRVAGRGATGSRAGR